MARIFIDTNVLIYAFVHDQRTAVAQGALGRPFELSVQVLNEFANVARRKLGFSWEEVTQGLSAVRQLSARIHLLDLGTHEQALTLAQRHNLSLFDALIVASALRAGCDTLLSEDMQDGLKIEDRLTIRNPFAA